MSRFRLAVPRGPLTVSDARTALLAHILASKESGERVLVGEPSEQALSDLRWLGTSWDGGVHPTRQEAALAYLERLSSLGALYPCPCPEDAEHPRGREEPQGAPRRYRLKRPLGEPLRLYDILRGEIACGPEEMGDPVVADAQRRPTEDFIAAVSDLELEITDVVLGHEDLSWAALETALGRLFDKKAPRYLHLAPLAHGSPNPTIAELKAAGYLGTAVANALVLLGWTPPEEAEALSWDLIVLLYEPSRAVAPVIFDPTRLRSLNQAHLRALSFEELGEALSPFLAGAGMLSDERSPSRWARLAREELATLAEVRDLAYLVDASLTGPQKTSDEVSRLLFEPSSAPVLTAALEILARGEVDFHTVRAYIEAKTGCRRKQLFFPLRAALTGRLYGPPLPEILPFLGADECRRRIASWLKTR